jgi:hypothetical protein
MAWRKIKLPVTLENTPIVIHYNAEYSEYRVRITGKPEADYFTSDKADAYATGQQMRNTLLRKNPAPKRKTSARTQKAAESYVRRPSQITKKAPSKRLKKRRTVNLQSARGVFPNPKPRTAKKNPSVHFDIDVNSHNAKGSKAKTRTNPVSRKKEITVEQSLDKKNWTIFARFPDTPDGSKNAIEYAKAYSKKEPYLHLRVMTK